MGPPASEQTNGDGVRGNVQLAVEQMAVNGLLGPGRPEGTRLPLRRRGRDLLGADSCVPASLIRNDQGVLLWHDGPLGAPIPGRRMSRQRRAGAAPAGALIETIPFERLEPNAVTGFLEGVDRMLNRDAGVRRIVGGAVQGGRTGAVAGQKKRLLLVHGTFSKTQALLDGIGGSPDHGRAFWQWAAGYDEVLCFDHPTLAVGPVLNALDLSRALAGASGPLDIIAHSRGGLVVRWLLEVLGAGGCTPCRAVLVGCPLAGTGLASPPRLKTALSALTNVGAAMIAAGELASVAQPWIAGPTALMRIATSFTGALGATPAIDAAVALIPGLFAQSRVGNNPELKRLRAMLPPEPPRYFVVRSDFRSESPGWRFWRYFALPRMAEVAAGRIFEGKNDLVVDTPSMDDLAESTSKPVRADLAHDFDTNDVEHHLNYFRQPHTLDAVQRVLA